MKEETKQNILNSLVSGKSLTTVLSAKAKEFMFESVQNELVTKYETDGWEVYKRYKTSIRMQRRKPMDMAFEDDVWALFARMGFSFLNKDRNFRLPYSNIIGQTKCALFTNEMCKKKDFFSRQTKSV